MEVQRGWGMRLTNVPQGLDITIKIDEERRELRVEFQERIVEKKRESPKKKSVDLTCHYCGALGHKYVHCPARWEVEGRRSTDLRLRVGPSSPLPEDNFCFTCGAAGLPKGHNCSEIASLLASVVNRLAEARPVEVKPSMRIELMGLYGEPLANVIMESREPFVLPMMNYERMELMLFVLYFREE
ncbi:hypothetical protein R1sor_016991 [Riccia sorocarpa]|uniref:CCHC-type domain-containing protein n=1 Tax=Riccia sorocarpa TaxID=122646 RepID=A0ABD3I8W9_9MARC